LSRDQKRKEIRRVLDAFGREQERLRGTPPNFDVSGNLKNT